MEMWNYHDTKMKQLKKIYNRISKQTQNRLQEIFDSVNFAFQDIYKIADNKTKKRINVYIEEWKDKELLNGYFGVLANNIHKRTRVKNSEILELLIYSAYIEEQNKLQETEINTFKDIANYYYQEGKKEVNKKETASLIPDAVFLALLAVPNVKGWVYEDYIQTMSRYNSEQIYRQYVIDLQQQKEPDITNDIYQNIIRKQQNTKLSIKDDKISGDVDLTLIGINNMAKVEGIKKEAGNNAKVIFLANIDGKETEMCNSLNNQEFYIDKENVFDRYYGETQNDLSIRRIKCKGLVLGLNLPPISHHFHFCRSIVQYVPVVEKSKQIEYNMVDYIRKNHYTDNKNLDINIKKAIKLLPKNALRIIEDTKYKITNKNSYYDRKTNTVYLLNDSNKYEILHEIGHVIETKLDLLHDKKYIEIQNKGLENINLVTDTQNIKYYQDNMFLNDTGKFVSEYQRRIYDNDIDGNYIIDYNTYKFNTRTLGEYFSEGFRCYFEENKLLKRKDIELYNYIKEVIK